MKTLFKICWILFMACLWSIQPVSAQEEIQTLTVRYIGDILIHDALYEQARTAEAYNFDPMFEQVASYLQNADLTLANLETIVAGNQLGASSYPFFNTPGEIVTSLKNAGVDLVNNNTNHTLDFGAQGAHLSIQELQDRGMTYVGSYQSWEDYNSLRIQEINGISIGFLSYANDANGNYIPEDEGYLFTQIHEELIRLEVEMMADQADIVCVYFQIGEEYEYLPSPYVMRVFNIARDAGAHFIFGVHPHVVQPYIVYNASQGAHFSNGNFISGQVELDTKIGGIGEITFAKGSEGSVWIERIRWMPTYNTGGYNPGDGPFLVVPLAEAENYGFYNGAEIMADLKDRLTLYTNKVEVVDYLD